MTVRKGTRPTTAGTVAGALKLAIGNSQASKPKSYTSQESQRPRRGGRASRRKGDRGERALVRFLQDRGFAAERVPLSGAAGGRYAGDLTIPLLGRDLCAEVKVRALGFSQLYAWLEGRDVLVVRRDRDEALVVLPMHLAIEIFQAAERGPRP